MSCSRKNPVSPPTFSFCSHLKVVVPEMLSSFEPTGRPFMLHVPTRRFSRWSAGLGAAAFWSCESLSAMSHTSLLWSHRPTDSNVSRGARARRRTQPPIAVGFREKLERVCVAGLGQQGQSHHQAPATVQDVFRISALAAAQEFALRLTPTNHFPVITRA